MSWLHTSIPLYQLLALLTVYVLYKEFVKLLLKSLVKYLKAKRLEKLVRSGALSINEARSIVNEDR